MDWIIAGALGLLVGWGMQAVCLYLLQYYENEKESDTYHKSHNHYRDGDNT
tara:strand:+ start:188 stop:340 length:153 start_codon:yes stop_codon:yes gene_type:complete